MSTLQKRLFFSGLLLQLLLIFTVSSRDLFGLLAEGGNIFPDSLRPLWTRAQKVASRALGESFGISNPWRQSVGFYTQCAGIDSGYSFFAPNVPNSYKLVFEVKHPDGASEVELPEVGGMAAGLRLATLLENLGQIQSEPLRRRTLEKLSYPVWRAHPDATRIRAILGVVLIPAPAEFLRGGRESYDVICVYDFFPPRSALQK